jgi:hypothetical protein
MGSASVDRLPRLLAICVAIVWACSARCAADEIKLRSGATFQGQWLNASDSSQYFIIRTRSGGLITLDAAHVAGVTRTRPEEVEYESLAERAPGTAAGQWELAEWCRTHGLGLQQRLHLQRVVELDPQHVAARRALGSG